MSDFEMFLGRRFWALEPACLRAWARLIGGIKLDRAELRAVAAEDRAVAARSAKRATGANEIAVVPLLGLMSQRGGLSTASTDDYARAVAAAAQDPNVKAVVLELDSPGGEFYGLDEAAAVIRDSRRAKPIVASVNSFAASGAYYLASQATEILVTPGGELGSIGVFAVHKDLSIALDQEGIKITLIAAGEGKVEGNPFEPLTAEALATMQADVQRHYGMFAAAVAKGRAVPVDRVRNEWKARIYGSRQAVDLGMADAVGTLDEAIARADSLARARGAVAASADLEAEVRMRARARAGRLYAGVVPPDVSKVKAPEETPWTAPTLGDFTDQPWGDLTDAQKRRIAGHYAWSAEMPPATFGSLKLPHHRPSDGAVVWRGVSAAMTVLLGGRGGADLPAADRREVYNHLAAHYRQFDKEPPDFK